MPWKECSVTDERLRFVARLLDGEAMTDVCREFGISRKTGYKIFDRYKEHGLSALMGRSRWPVRTVSESMRTPILSLGATSSSIASRIKGTPAFTITLPIQKPGAPDTTFVEDEICALGDARHAQARLGSSRRRSSSPIRAGWRARADRCRSAHRTSLPRSRR
jgi:transposase-like protein